MIDTETKRRSVQAYATGLMRPLADGTINTGDRACCAWLYAGLSYAPVSAAHSINIGTGISPTQLTGGSSGIGSAGISRPTSEISYFIAWLFGERYDHAFC